MTRNGLHVLLDKPAERNYHLPLQFQSISISQLIQTQLFGLTSVAVISVTSETNTFTKRQADPLVRNVNDLQFSAAKLGQIIVQASKIHY